MQDAFVQFFCVCVMILGLAKVIAAMKSPAGQTVGSSVVNALLKKLG